MKVGYIYKDELVERKLKMGDVLHIDAGSTFYMVNTGKGQRLQIICSIDASDSLGFGPPYLVSLFTLHLSPYIFLFSKKTNIYHLKFLS